MADIPEGAIPFEYTINTDDATSGFVVKEAVDNQIVTVTQITMDVEGAQGIELRDTTDATQGMMMFFPMSFLWEDKWPMPITFPTGAGVKLLSANPGHIGTTIKGYTQT